MTDTTAAPLTDQQFAEIRARAEVATDGPWERYEQYGPDFFACTTGSYLRGVGTFNFGDGTDAEADEEFVKHAVQDVRTLVAEVRRLRAQVDQLDRALGETIDDRDRMHEIADKLAYAVASEEVIGEHSSMNCPWTNALELITPKAEVDKLRARIAELERPAVEAKRAEIRDSYAELIAQAEQDRDFEGAFDVQCRLREREEQWKAEDAATVPAAVETGE